jgi:O-antigen/teichoic acid export membrane protein
MILVLCSVAINVLLTYPLTMVFGPVGTATGTLTASAILSIAHLNTVHRKIPSLRALDRPWRLFVPFIAGGLCLFIPADFFGFNPLPLTVACPLLYFLGVVEGWDFNQMRVLVAKRR